jgi:hypothetical protein
MFDEIQKRPDALGKLLPGKTADPNTVIVPTTTVKGRREADETYTNLFPNVKKVVLICSAATIADTIAVQVKERLRTAPDSTIRQCQANSPAPWLVLNSDFYARFRSHVRSPLGLPAHVYNCRDNQQEQHSPRGCHRSRQETGHANLQESSRQSGNGEPIAGTHRNKASHRRLETAISSHRLRTAPFRPEHKSLRVALI